MTSNRDLLSLRVASAFDRGEAPDIKKLLGSFFKGQPTIIAVMGTTGVGKSTFIRYATGDNLIKVGNDLTSYTQSAKLFRVPNTDIVLMDTPGFDDTYKNDVDILESIANGLKECFTYDCKVSGVIYIHAITEPRMKRTAVKNLSLFRKIVGLNNMDKCCLVTTKWSKQPVMQSIAHEEQLKTTSAFWAPLLERGAQVARFRDNKESAMEIVNQLADSRQFIPQLTQEFVIDQKPLVNTAAGQEVNDNLEDLKRAHEKEILEMRELHDEAIQNKDLELANMMAKERAEFERKLQKTEQQIARMQNQNRGPEFNPLNLLLNLMMGEESTPYSKRQKATTADGHPFIALVTGPTGAGKSTLVQIATGDTDIRVGNSLRSCTKDTGLYPIPGTNIYLMDTPGFDDTVMSDATILEKIGASLLGLGETCKISCILYLHPITEARMTRTALKNLRLFKKIVGAENMSKCCLVTTKWSKEDATLADAREIELKEDEQFWKPLLDKGAHMARFSDSKQSVLDILDSLGVSGSQGFRPKLVEELSHGIPLEQTAAGKEVSGSIEEITAKLGKEKADLQREYDEAIGEGNEEMAAIISKEQTKHEEQLEGADQARKLLTMGVTEDSVRRRMRQWSTLLGLPCTVAAIAAVSLTATAIKVGAEAAASLRAPGAATVAAKAGEVIQAGADVLGDAVRGLSS
ncbi:hypothetical protein Dda_5521 [Drechslerella dactyloides]|uniref:G domain-containing protein n=1 Tax=Drechslerella dactyloides TaxID=74499 RepID=A0AAD6IWY4_DREDA|nr:hypothetical protein Dda_5521 [Drechslerella dactyloides]